MSREIGFVQDVARSIGDEASLHVRLLDDVQPGTETVTDSLMRETRQVKDLEGQTNTRSLWCIIVGLTVVFFIMVFAKA